MGLVYSLAVVEPEVECPVDSLHTYFDLVAYDELELPMELELGQEIVAAGGLQHSDGPWGFCTLWPGQ